MMMGQDESSCGNGDREAGLEADPTLDLLPNLSGKIVDQCHLLPIRVYYEDTDFSGLVYHASYLRWCERARTEFVRLIGLNQRALYEGQNCGDESGGSQAGGSQTERNQCDRVFFVVRRMEIDFLRPALMDDLIEVSTRPLEIGAATVELNQEIVRRGEILFRAQVKIVLIDEEGRPKRLTSAVRGAFDL